MGLVGATIMSRWTRTSKSWCYMALHIFLLFTPIHAQVNTLTECFGFDRESAIFALRLVEYRSVAEAANILLQVTNALSNGSEGASLDIEALAGSYRNGEGLDIPILSVAGSTAQHIPQDASASQVLQRDGWRQNHPGAEKDTSLFEDYYFYTSGRQDELRLNGKEIRNDIVGASATR